MAESDQENLQALFDSIVGAGRKGGPSSAQAVMDLGGFDLPAYLIGFKADWRLLWRNPMVWWRHRRWQKFSVSAGRSSLEDWELLKSAEVNIARVEFGRLRLDPQERIRLRNIRQGHGQSWWHFRELLASFAISSRDGRIQLRAPSRCTTRVVGGVWRVWSALCFYLLVQATIRLYMAGCLTCDVAGIYMLIPEMVTIWAFLYIFGDGWWKSWNELRGMSIASERRHLLS